MANTIATFSDSNTEYLTKNKKVPSIEKLYQLLLTNHSNYGKLLAMCKKFTLLPNHLISEPERPDHYTFLRILQQTEHNIARSISVPTLDTLETIFANLTASDDSLLTEYTDEVKSSCKHLKVITTGEMCKSTSAIVPVYPMGTRNRGILFFVNIRRVSNQPNGHNRVGSEDDKFYVINLFRKFGFKIYYYENLLSSTLFDLIDKLIKYHLDDTESLVFIVAAYGNENGQIELYLEEKCEVRDILIKFNDTACLALKGKPKVFLFPSCGRSQPNPDIDTCSVDPRPIYSDMLICYSTTHENEAERDPSFCSRFIEAFSSLLAQNGHNTDLETILYSVTDLLYDIDIKKGDLIYQTPTYVKRDFNKMLYFNPGYVGCTEK